ncbi:hypothetical protein D3C86_2172530 [compost metagenome]
MFNKKNIDDYLLAEIRISDPERGDHFTSLISNVNNVDKIKLIEDDLKKFNK